MSATGSSGSLLERYASIRSVVNAIWTRLIDSLTSPSNRVLRACSTNILALGVVPGPNKPVDMDSFLIPLAEELFQLAAGVKTYNGLSNSHFNLRAFLLVVFGDFPAVSMLMKMKGVNGISPCRSCKIRATQIPSDKNRTYYVPPSVDLTELGRSHGELMAQAELIDKATTQAEAEEYAKEFGIKGRSMLSDIDSLCLPQSFPPDFMHVAWENVTKTLVTLWTGDYKGLSEGTRKYRTDNATWEVGARGAASCSTIPSTFGPHIPNVSEKGSYMLSRFAPICAISRRSHSSHTRSFFDMSYFLFLSLFISTAAP